MSFSSPMFIWSLLAIKRIIVMVLISLSQMLEIGACMELKSKSGELMEGTDTEFADISFEELLAQEKKDSFWLVAHLLNPGF